MCVWGVETDGETDTADRGPGERDVVKEPHQAKEKITDKAQGNWQVT